MAHLMPRTVTANPVISEPKTGLKVIYHDLSDTGPNHYQNLGF